MTHRLLTLALATALCTTTFAQPQTATQLRQHFLNPPGNAKPMMRWWWFGPAVEKPEILRELQQMKADGIGGVELAFVYPEVLDDPGKNLVNQRFVGPAMLDDVRYAQSEGRRLGLRVDVTLGSGWPYGGPSTTLDEAAGRLRMVETALPPGSGTVAPPQLAEGESFVYEAIVEGDPKHWDAATATPILPATSPQLPRRFPPNPRARTALFFIASHTGQVVKRASVGAEGWVLDPFSHQAVANHLKTVGDPLVRAFGSTPPYAVFSDSLEAYGADWTPALPAEFKKRRNYNLLPHLPEIVRGGTPAAEKARHDWGVTLTELVNENYLTQINNWAIAHHTRFRSQTYGEPAVSFSSQRLVALPEGEDPQWRAFSTLRWASSANHVFGNNVTSAETFTWLHSPVFRATPLDMKAEADLHFIMGTNQIIGHGWPYSAPQVPEPGWSLYAAAAFNDHNPWHPVMPDVTRYIQRISYLLRQGKPANQVAILLPTDDAWATFAPSHVTITGAMQRLITPQLMSAILSSGYNVDYIDADAIKTSGLGSHQLLVLPPTDRIPLPTLRAIAAFIHGGGKVFAVGHTPTLDPDGNASPEMTKLTAAIPVVASTDDLAKALSSGSPAPDLKLSSTDSPSTHDAIGFIRRRLPAADIYFVVNTSNHPIDATASFATAHSSAEQWDIDTATASPASAKNQPLHLEPYESRVFYFSNAARGSSVTSRPSTFTQLAGLTRGWKVTFTATGRSKDEAAPTDWTADPATRNYSGEAVYSKDITLDTAATKPIYLEVDGGEADSASSSLPERAVLGANGLPDPRITRPGPGMRARFVPPLREAAIVTVNGQRAGSLWHPPYRIAVTHLLKPGTNHIEIRVYNTAINAWAALPPHDYKALIARYGDRFQMQDLNKVTPQSSGILGAIHLVQEIR